MKRTHFKDRSKRNRLDLTLEGRYELIIPALTRMREQDLIRAREDERTANVPPLPPLPRYTPEKVNYWQVIRSAININQYLP